MKNPLLQTTPKGTLELLGRLLLDEESRHDFIASLCLLHLTCFDLDTGCGFVRSLVKELFEKWLPILLIIMVVKFPTFALFWHGFLCVLFIFGVLVTRVFERPDDNPRGNAF